MLTGTLVIWVTKNDQRMRDFAVALQGVDNQHLTRYKERDFGKYDGSGTYPLILVGHANEENFITDYSGWKTYESPSSIASNLKSWGLAPSRFSCVLIAGCKAAGKLSTEGLYIGLGDELNLPVTGSSTTVSMELNDGNISLTPQDSGEWKVYFPSEKTVYKLDAQRSSGVSSAIGGSIFQCQ